MGYGVRAAGVAMVDMAEVPLLPDVEFDRRRLSAHQLYGVLDALKDSMVIIDGLFDGSGPRVLYANAAFVALNGWSESALVGQSIWRLVGPRTDRHQAAEARGLLEAGQPFEGRVWTHRADGQAHQCDWSLRPVWSEGEVTHIVGTQRPVAGTRAASRGHRLMAAAVLDGDAVVAAVLDAEQRLLLASPAFLHAMGLQRADIPGFSLGMLRSTLQPGPASETFLAACTSGESWRGDLRTRAELGGAVLAVQLHTVRDPDTGAVEGRVLTGVDETEPRRLLKLAENVSLADQISQAFGGLRHELGNPVNSVRMAASLLARRWREMEIERVDFYLTGMLQELDRMEFLLRSMRSFNETEQFEVQRIPLAPLVTAFNKLVDLRFRQSGARFVIEVAEHLEAWCDRRALFQVLVNLVNNALDAACDRIAPEVRLTATLVGGRVRMTVSDNGHGMSEEVLRRATQPFFTSKPKGTGLGLAIVRNLLTRMGSRLSLSSLAGHGTQAWFLLAGPDSGPESSVELGSLSSHLVGTTASPGGLSAEPDDHDLPEGESP